MKKSLLTLMAITVTLVLFGGCIINLDPSADYTNPKFTVAPAATNITSTSFDITATIDEGGKIYVLVLEDGATTPTKTEIKEGLSATAVANTEVTINVTGKTAATAYDVYVLAEDDESSPNVQYSATKVNVTTEAGTVTPTTGWLVVANATKMTDVKCLMLTTNTVTVDNFDTNIYSITNETVIGTNENLVIADIEPATYTVRISASNFVYNETGEEKCVYELYTNVTITVGATNTLTLEAASMVVSNSDTTSGLTLLYFYTEFDTNYYDAGFDWLNTVDATGDTGDIVAADDYEYLDTEIIAGTYKVQAMTNASKDPVFDQITLIPGENLLEYDGDYIVNLSN